MTAATAAAVSATTWVDGATLPLSVEVTLPADGTIHLATFGHLAALTEYHATRVDYRAHRSHHAQTGEPIVVVSVTAYTRTGRNKTWMDPRHFVATGLDASTVPAWVPEAPEWFWDVVADMAAAARTTHTSSTTSGSSTDALASTY